MPKGKPKPEHEKVSTHIAVHPEAHRFLKFLRLRYQSDSYSQSIIDFATDAAPELMADFRRLMLLEEKMAGKKLGKKSDE